MTWDSCTWEFQWNMKALALKPSVSWNSNVFTALLKASRLSSVRMCRGRAFHRRGALYANVLLPYGVFRKQVFSFKKSSGRQLYDLNSSWILFGLFPWMLLYTSSKILNIIRDSILNQCKSLIVSEIDSRFRLRTTSRAAAFWTFCNLFIFSLLMLKNKLLQ